MVLVENKLGEEVEFQGAKLKDGEEKNVNVSDLNIGKIVLIPVESDDAEEMTDDYLDQNANTVRKALREDDLSQKNLKRLFQAEKNGKDRKTVKEAIKKKLD